LEQNWLRSSLRHPVFARKTPQPPPVYDACSVHRVDAEGQIRVIGMDPGRACLVIGLFEYFTKLTTHAHHIVIAHRRE
jgi:hypothetical protein